MNKDRAVSQLFGILGARILVASILNCHGAPGASCLNFGLSVLAVMLNL